MLADDKRQRAGSNVLTNLTMAWRERNDADRANNNDH